MPLKCVVSTCCGSSSDTVFNFPIPRFKREKWLKALNLDVNYEFDGPTGVCERHFNPIHVKKVSPTTLLGLNAVPDLVYRGPILSQLLKVPVILPTTTITPDPFPNKNVEIIVVQSPDNSESEEVKMEIDEYLQPASNQIETLITPMIEPDSIKIEVENVECDVLDPLDPDLDRIQYIYERNKGNADLQTKMKELKVKIREQRKKVQILKRNLKRNNIKYDKLVESEKQYKEDIKKITHLRNIYLKPELTIPRLIYDRFGIIEFDGLKYPNDLKQFAIELYSKSPVAYDYVRMCLCNVIPHPDAILRWTKPTSSVKNED